MRVVVKIGSSSLTDEAGHLRLEVIDAVVGQIAAVRALGHEVVLVGSGAGASGVAGRGRPPRPAGARALQARSAVGQPRLMAAYRDAFASHSLVTAQVLLVPHDFVDRQQYLHARATLGRLLEYGCLPVINENDAIANNEIRYGDNDHLAALVAHLVAADMLVLLTDTDGLYTDDPRTNPGARRVEHVSADDPLLSVTATEKGSDRGSGGMASKLASARIASWSGVTAVIAAATREGAVVAAVEGDESMGTRFEPHDRNLSARKLWIAFASETEGTVTVDDGARAALTGRGTSLLPAGVTSCGGTFEAGATIEILDAAGTVVARGMSTMSSAQVAGAAGKRSADLDPSWPVEVVHRDDLVVLV